MNKTIIAVFTLLLLYPLLLQPIAIAQEGEEDMLKMFTSDVMRQGQRNQMKAAYISFWNGNGTNLMINGLLHRPEFKEGLGVTEEQMAQFRMSADTFYQNPEVTAALAEMQKYQTPSDPYLSEASPEAKAAFLVAQDKFAMLMLESITNGIDTTFTPEQKQRMQEFQLAGMETLPIINMEIFEPLGLSDEQRQELEQIKKELEPEFDRIADELVDALTASMDLLLDELQKEGAKITNMKEFEDKMDEIVTKLEAKGIDYKAPGKKHVDRARDFAKAFKFRMYDVLTDEQMEKMKQLIDNPPDWMAPILAKMKKKQEEQAKEASWQPGPQSWQPGDPIPDEYIQQRKARFPKK